MKNKRKITLRISALLITSLIIVGFTLESKKTSNNERFEVSPKTENGSDNLEYSVYKVENNNPIKIDSIEGTYKGVVETKGNTIIETIPIYSETDSTAEPSIVQKKYYTIIEDKVVLEKTEEVKYSSEVQSYLSGTSYYKNPTYKEIEKIIESVAYEKGIPSVILKAVAWAESNGTDGDNSNIANWRQFKNGSPLIGYDGKGIGIMQVSDYLSTDTEYINRLKYDVEFNINKGADIFLNKWTRQISTWNDKIPAIGNKKPTYLENWYFPIWAYNGYSFVNNPASNANPYQKKVIGFVNNVFNTPMLDLGNYLDSTQFRKEENNGEIKYVGSWTTYTNSNLSGGTAKYSINSGDYMEFSFYGFGIQLISYKNKYKSIIKVTLDNDEANAQYIDLYSEEEKFKQAIYTKTLLSLGLHTIKVEITNQKNPSSLAFSGAIDSIDILPNKDIAEVANSHLGDVKKKELGIKYLVNSSTLSIKNDSMTTIGNYSLGDIVEVVKEPIFQNGYYYYYVTGKDKQGLVRGNYLKPIGDVNNDNIINIYDLTKISKAIEGSNTIISSSNIGDIGKYDVNMDKNINIQDISDAKINYNKKLYTVNLD